MKKTALFTTAAIVAMAGVATAGTLKTGTAGTSVSTYKVAKEEVDGHTAAAPLKADLTTFLAGTFIPADPGDPLAVPPIPATAAAVTDGIVVVPSTIPLATLTNGVMNFTATAGKWTVSQGADQLQICDDAGVPQLAFKTGSGSNSIVFDTSSGTSAGGQALAGNISNGKGYFMAWGTGGVDCQAAPTDPAASLLLDVPPATSTIGLTVQTGIATTQQIYDTAPASGSAAIVAVGYQLSGAVTKPAGIQIDFDQNFTKLINTTTTPATTGITQDTLGVSVSAAVKDLPATFGAGDKVITTITLSDAAGLKATGTATGIDVTEDALGNPAGIFADATCVDVVAATGKIVCTSVANAPLVDAANPPAAAVTENFEYTVNVEGTTAITEKTFNVSTEFDFANAATQDRTVANSNALLTNTPAGSWTFRGTTIYVPLVKEGNGANTFIKLQSKANAAVRGLVLCSDGISRAVDLGTITAGTPKAITSTNVVTALNGVCTVDPLNGYAMTLSVTSDKANVFGYANTVDALGNAKRIPLSTTSGVDN